MTTKLKHLLVDMNMTQKRLAELTRVNPTTLNMIVNGKSLPTLRTAQKVAKALGTTVDYLWPVDDEEE